MSDIDWVRLQAHGKLEQTCPRCLRSEAAGHYCTFCNFTGMEPYWRIREVTEAQRANLAAARSLVKRKSSAETNLRGTDDVQAR